MKQIRYVSPTGMLGVGFSEDHFRAALTPDTAFIGCDSGSTDGGPAYLGANKFFFSRAAIKRDMRILVTGARSIRKPLLIGSCGGSGGNWNLQWMWEIVQEIAREEGLHFRTALIAAEPDRDALVRKWREGRIRPLANAPAIDEQTLRDTDRIVAMMGTDPYIAALEAGADVVLAGRSSDAALFAAIPIQQGFDPGLCWHAAKIMECGGAAVTQMKKPEGMICTVRESDFVLEPVSPHQQCSPTSIASHALYETANPYRMAEPGGVMDLEGARYEAVDERAVRVSGSAWHPGPYTVKLEGAKLAGYQAQVLGGVRDPVILQQFDSWLDGIKDSIRENVDEVFGRPMAGEYEMHYKVYGRDAVLGEREPLRGDIGHEVGLLMVALAPTEAMAYTIAAQAAHMALHRAVPQWQGLVSNLAFPVAPHITPLGPTYRFALNHVVELDHPLEFHQPRIEEI
jgi:hypothetical protein